MSDAAASDRRLPVFLSGGRAIVPALKRLPMLLAGDGKPDPLFGVPRRELDFLPEALEIVERPAPPAPRLIALGVSGLVLTALLWAILGHVDMVSTATGRVVAIGGGKVIQPLEPGKVASIVVTDGQFVRAGQILVTLDPTPLKADRDDLAAQLATARLQVARVRTVALGVPFVAPGGADPAAALLTRREAEAERAAQVAKLDALKGQVNMRQSDIAVADAELDRLKALGPVADTRLEIIHNLEAKGYASRLRSLDAESQSKDVANSIVAQQRRLPGAQAALATAREAASEATAQFTQQALADLTEAEVKASSLADALQKAQSRLEAATLRAPVDGMVQELALHTIGGVVSAGEPILRISPSGGSVEVDAQLENRDVGFVQAGMSVDVKIDTFPFTRYGTVPGTVVSVSGDAVAPPPGTEPRQPTGYSARIRLSRSALMVDGRPHPLTPGMAVVAEIKTGHRRIIDYLLSPMQRISGEAGRER